MARTIFRTPVIRPLLRLIAGAVLRLWGWRVVGQPPELNKFILCAAPHTSNWDFPLMLLVMLKLDLDVHWMGKQSLFPRPIGGLMRWLGGLPIDRSRSNDTVRQMVTEFAAREELVILIPPEGTRSQVKRWRTGFYHIACGAGVPIQLGFLDARTRTAGFGPLFQPCGDVERDLPEIQAFYRDKRGLRHHRAADLARHGE